MNVHKEGLVFQEAHFPGRIPIDAYGNGGFRFAEMSHRGSIMCLPSGVYGWEAKKFVDLDINSFERVFQESDKIEVLLVGTGQNLERLPDQVKEKFRTMGIMSDTMATGAAVRTFNVLVSENRAVATCLLAVD